MSRTKLPTEIEKNILINSKRRCALCYGLNRDIDIKKGQIAHIDRDSSNHSQDNLLFLCLSCHDLYDTKPSQSKGITIKELKHYRDELYKAIENDQIYINKVEDPDQKVIMNVIELLRDSTAINWLQNLTLTAPFTMDYICYFEGFNYNSEQDPFFCFKDSQLEKYRGKIYWNLKQFMYLQGITAQYNPRTEMCQIPPNISDKRELCSELDKYRASVIVNYFNLIRRAKKLNYL